MKSIHLLLLLGTFCVLIVPSFQYGTIFTDYLSTPVNFTDITETYISGIKSKTAYANTASVDTITATNPDGFYVNSPGPLTAEAGQNLEFTSAQSVVFGNADSISTSLTSGGALNIQNDRTDVDVDELTLSTGKTLSLLSEGPLNIQGNNIDIAADGNGFVSARDVTVDSATNTEVLADANILLNSTYHSSFITQNGDISILADGETTFDSNFINIDSSYGVDINSAGDVNIQAFAILEMQAAQFAQVHARENVNVNVLNGDFDVNAAATTAIASGNDLHFTAANRFEIYSFGDSESVVQFNARSGLTSFVSFSQLTIGTFVDSYDVDLIASGSMYSFSHSTNFVANQDISTLAGQDLEILASDDVLINSLDLVASSYGNTEIASVFDDVTFDTQENFNAQGRDTFLITFADLEIDSREVSFLQGAPAILSRSEPSSLILDTNSITSISTTTQFETIGDFVLSTPEIDVSAVTVDIRSSAGPHNVLFNVGGDFNVIAQDDIKYLASTINIEPETLYTTLSTSLNFVSGDSSRNIFQSGTDTFVNAPVTSFSSNGDTTIEAEFDEVNMIMSDNFIQNSYNNYLQTFEDITISSDHTIAVGANEYINVESVFDSTFDANAAFIRASQTGSLFADDVVINAPTTNLRAEDTLYFTANLPTNSLDITSNNVTFVGSTVFESGRNLQITALGSSSFTGTKLHIAGYDYNTFNTPTFTVNANGQITISSDGAIDTTAADLIFNQLEDGYYFGSSNSHFQLNAVEEILLSTGFINEYANTFELTSTTTEVDSEVLYLYGDDLFSIESENTIEMDAGVASLSGEAVRFRSLLNDIQSDEAMVINTNTEALIKAGLNNVFTSGNTLSSTSVNAWFTGGNLELDANSLDFEAVDGGGYFYSDDQITFNVENGITLTSTKLNFVLPLDGSLFLEGDSTSILGGSAFNFISQGATTLTAEGAISYNTDGLADFISVTTEISADEISLFGTVEAAVTFFAHEGEVNFDANDYNLKASTNSFMASRDINIKGNVEFRSKETDASTPVRLNSVLDQSGTATLAILAETYHEDSHIVFHAFAGDISTFTTTGDIIINTEGLQTISGAYGVSTVSADDTNFIVNGNHNLKTATGTSFTSNNNWELDVVGQTYVESGLDISFLNTLTTDPNALLTVFSITAGSMTVSTSQEGPLHITSDSDIAFSTTSFQNWEITHSALTQSASSSYTSTIGDITTLTSSGKIFSDFSQTFVGSAGVNITFNSGHDSTFISGATTYSANNDVLTTSIDGKIVFTNIGDATFNAGSQILIDSEGPRTVPRDGVFLRGNNIFAEASGPSAIIYLYARRSVTFGEFTRPAVTFNAGGSPTQNGWVLTSDGKISLHAGTSANFNSDDQFSLSTSQATIYSSGAAMTLQSTGDLPNSANNIQISSLIGNVHFHSKLDSHWETPNQISATSSTGYIEFTTLGSATFEADGNFQSKANSLAYSFDSSYTSTSTSTSFDGHNYFDITTRLGSDGSIEFSSANSVFSSVGNFGVNTYGDDAKLELSALSELTIRTPKTGDITFNSNNEIFSLANNIREIAGEQYSVTANSNIGNDPSKGSIQYYVKGTTTLTSVDTIDLTSSMDVSILAASLDVDTTGNFLANSDYDQEWLIGSTSAQSFNSVFTVQRGIILENSNGGEGDINFFSSGNLDTTYFQSILGDIVENIGNNQIGYVSKGFRIATSGSDFKDAFGIRFQTEGPANLEVFSSASAVFNGHKNTRFDASDDLNVFGGIGISLVGQGVNFDNDGVVFVASNGDINFHTAQSPISFVGNHIDIIGNGTNSGEGKISVVANGINRDAEYGIRMQFDASVAAFGSIEGDINVQAKESIEIGLNFQGAHALFGYQRNAAEELANIFSYDPFYPYIPSNHLNVPLESETKVIATGIGADIVIDCQKTEDGIGQFIAYAGHIEEVPISHTNAPSQLQLIAHGNGEVMGDITFRQEGGLSFKGVDLLYEDNINTPIVTPPIASNILFLANDATSDVVIKTTKEAIFSDITHITTELTLNAENKLQIRSNGRNGDSNVQFDTTGKIYVQTTGPSQGPGTELPGIELRSYESKIEVDAGNFGDVIHHALRNMYLEADNGFEFLSLGDISFQTSTINFQSSAGGISFRHLNSRLTAADSIVISTAESGQEFLGNDVEIASDSVSFNTPTFTANAVGGDIIFNFRDRSIINAGPNNFVNVFGFMSIPQTDELIIPGTICETPTSANVQRIVIARSPPYDAYNIFNQGNSAAPQYAFYNADIYQGLGLRLCTCGANGGGIGSNFRWSCMNFSQFNL